MTDCQIRHPYFEGKKGSANAIKIYKQNIHNDKNSKQNMRPVLCTFATFPEATRQGSGQPPKEFHRNSATKFTNKLKKQVSRKLIHKKTKKKKNFCWTARFAHVRVAEPAPTNDLQHRPSFGVIERKFAQVGIYTDEFANVLADGSLPLCPLAAASFTPRSRGVVSAF